MNPRRALTPVLAALALLSLAVSASAAPKPASSTPTVTPSLSDTLSGEAKADYDAAKLLYNSGDNASALLKFTAAYDKSKDPRLLWNIAACEKNLHHYAALIAYLRRYIAEGQAVLTDAEKADAEALIKVTQPLTASVRVSASESGARVYVDDALVGETPLPAPVVVDIGGHAVRVEKEGFEPFRTELKIGDTPSVDLVATLERAIHDATVTVYTARPKDEVWIDGQLRGLGTWTGLVPSGTHALHVAAPGMKTYDSEFSVREKETRKIAMTLEPEPRKPPARVPLWVWIGGSAIVVAGGIVASYFLFKPDDKQAENPIGTLDPGSVQASFPYR